MDDEETLAILMEMASAPAPQKIKSTKLISLQKTKRNKPILIDLVSTDSSQEDPFDQILLNSPTKDLPRSRLKRKREESEEIIYSETLAPQSSASSQEPDSLSTSQVDESSEENSFLAEGEHYGTDEEEGVFPDESSSNGYESASSSNDEYEPSPKHFKKDKSIETKLAHPRYEQEIASSPKKKRSPLPVKQKIKHEVEEDSWDEAVPLIKNPTSKLSKMIDLGMRLKLLSNVYLGNTNAKANVFLPRYKVEIRKPNGKTKILEDWFKTKKDEICVFASGGLHYIWEKNIRHVNEIFFGERVKIIRAHWIQKHIYKNKPALEEDFSGEKQKDLHSELYYDLFFRKYFMPHLNKQVKKCSGTLKKLTIDAFSWWEVCNECEKKLSSHQELLGEDVSLSYKIAAHKPYKKDYPLTSLVENRRIAGKHEEKALGALWGCISKYTKKSFKQKKKRKFWTKTHEGLEVCKWFGQAFAEREIALDGRETLGKEGAMLSFYKKKQPKKVKALKTLLSYLYNENWDLSCWYKGPFPYPIQYNWKKHWKQVCVPHFGWEDVHSIEKKKEKNDKRRGRRPAHERQTPKFDDKKDWKGNCEMCGKEGIENVFRIFHPKLHGSKKFLNFTPAEQKQRESSLRHITHKTPLAELAKPLQKKRLQSLCVGSECVKYLTLKKKAIEEWRECKGDEEIDSKTREQAKRLRENDLLDEAEKGFRQSKKRKKK